MPRISEMPNLFKMIKKADDGDPYAQWRVAWYIVYDDLKEEIDPDWAERAIDYFERAAAQGHGDAMLDFADMYNLGRGVIKDKEKEYYWINEAVKNLVPRAFINLILYNGVPYRYYEPHDEAADYKTVFKYALKGALLDEPCALIVLGDMFFAGKYVEADPRFAMFLLERAASIVDWDGDDCCGSICLRYGECCYTGKGTNQDIDKARNDLIGAIE